MLQRLRTRKHFEHIALTPGAASALKSQPADLLVAPAADLFRQYWSKETIICIVGALGASTRLIAPFLTGKDLDPAVLVLDAKAKHVVPLIGGHASGGEALAFEIAADIGADPVITNDSNSQERLAIDSFGEAWGWRRGGKTIAWNKLMHLLSQGRQLDFEQHSGTTEWQLAKAASNGCFLSSRSSSSACDFYIGPFRGVECCWHPPNIWIGIGCERNTSLSIVKRALGISLDTVGIAIEAIAGLASVEIKADEACILSMAASLGCPIRLFTNQELSKVNVPNPSVQVANAIGISSVAESAALLAAGHLGKLLFEKRVFSAQDDEVGAVTIAIAESAEAFAPNRGELHLVGSGPGDLSFLTYDSRRALSRSVVWIGYGLYLDLLEPLRRPDQVRIESQITQERDRCIYALKLARQGIRVALISSGDSGIYGMAGLALELWLEQKVSQRPVFQVHPGISALQLAAARVGAPLMHDFCTVSLSDRLTPWEKIEARVRSAAEGDFVIAIYNPRSKDRLWQLNRVFDLLLEFRSPNTPALLARNLGREGEKVHLYTLDSLPVEEVDMLSLVIIGNSESRQENGQMITPRGYK